MRKIWILLFALALIWAIAIPASAATPSLVTPDMPEIPDISDDVNVELPDKYWDNYFMDNPFKIDWTKVKINLEIDWSKIFR